MQRCYMACHQSVPSYLTSMKFGVLTQSQIANSGTRTKQCCGSYHSCPASASGILGQTLGQSLGNSWFAHEEVSAAKERMSPVMSLFQNEPPAQHPMQLPQLVAVAPLKLLAHKAAAAVLPRTVQLCRLDAADAATAWYIVSRDSLPQPWQLQAHNARHSPDKHTGLWHRPELLAGGTTAALTTSHARPQRIDTTRAYSHSGPSNQSYTCTHLCCGCLPVTGDVSGQATGGHSSLQQAQWCRHSPWPAGAT